MEEAKMGVEFRTFLIPRDNAFRPDAATARRLIAALQEAKFIPDADAVMQLADREARLDESADLSAAEFILRWSVDDRRRNGLEHPLADIVEDAGHGAYYDVRLNFADDFVEVVSESIDPLPNLCACGQDLGYDAEPDIFYAGRVRRICPSCTQPYRPQDHAATHRDGISGAEREIMGGAYHRFAIVIDCGKHWRTDGGAAPLAAAAFVSAVQLVLGQQLYEVGEFY
jgi:hypothetical protein